MAKYDFFASKKASVISRILEKTLRRKFEQKFFLNFKRNVISVLEIGVGKGEFAQGVIRRNVEYTGYEPNGKMLESLLEKGINVKQVSVPPFPEEDNRFDGIMMIQVFEHMPTLQAAEEVLKESYRVLRDDGKIMIISPSYLAWKDDFFDLDFTHTFPTTANRLQQMLQDSGFYDVRICYYWGGFFSEVWRIADIFLRLLRSVAGFFLPRSVAYSTRFRKLGMLFAENICVEAYKQAGK
ncbi:MAG: class I SAM-dependent methyltransferase [Fibrobacter sp.]|jgi:SAM-dependent methyltransferase|nr:class I SAM-dependent methyltransferase [Fibrobacter sp.]HON09871.1 class I SAM-dependent methyltransferase [Chitinispirillaceae bacterium]